MFINLLGGHGSFYIMFTIFYLFCSLTCSPLYVVSEVLGATQNILAIKELGNNGLPCTINFMVVLNVQTSSNGMWLIWWILTCCWCMMMFCAWLLVLLVLWLQTVNSAICMISFYISYISFLDVSGGLYGLGYSFWVAKGVPMSNLSRKDPAVTQELCVYGQPLPMQHGVWGLLDWVSMGVPSISERRIWSWFLWWS